MSTPVPCGRIVTSTALPVSGVLSSFSPLAGACSGAPPSWEVTAPMARSIAVFSETFGLTESSFNSVK
ncbi:hypothetical protein ACFVZT_29810 [Streptomyces sp. NPDC058321]|uniref:hypothetical protein n=1 Tax=Streptomyces sp. NPDC058321 TaxID=3346445 RepID=UPI0036EA17DD